jgi:TonB family protein
MSSKSGNDIISQAGTVVMGGGTAGHLPDGYPLREFTIERVLGEGGFSVVYLATDTRLERQVAIKEYMPTALATRNQDLSVHVRSSAQHREAFEAGLRSFINEAKMLARFEHRALVKVHQFWQEKGTAYMVMPYYSGPTLKNWSRQHHASVDSKWVEQFLRLVMDALDALHRENCLHRDVAPDNILILNESTPLLLDFGAARRVIGDLTQALTVILKPGFAPIEQYAESATMRQGPWTDVYALCAVGYFMITGRAPSPSVTRVLADDVVPLSASMAGRFPAALLAALDAGLTVRPQQRPQSIAALRELMDGAIAADETLTAAPAVRPAAKAQPAAPAPAPVAVTAPPQAAQPPKPAADDDDDRTRIVTARDGPARTGGPTSSAPPGPAFAPTLAPEADQIPDEPSFATRIPSRSLRELEPAVAGQQERDEDRPSKLPLVIGGAAIAVVIAGAAWLINWLNSEPVGQLRPAASAPAAPPPVVAAAPSPAPPASPSPAPAAAPPAQSAAVAPAPESKPPGVAAPAEPKLPAAPAASESKAATPPPSVEPKPPVPAAPAETKPQAGPAAEPKPPAVTAAVPTKAVPPAETKAPASIGRPPAEENKPAVSAPATRPAAPPTQAATKGAPATNTAAAPPAPSPLAKASPLPQEDPRAGVGKAAQPAKAQAPAETSRPRPPVPSPTPYVPPPIETAAPPATVQEITTVDVPPAPIAAAPVTRPAPAPATNAPLKVLQRPEPQFPRDAIRNYIDQGRVLAKLSIGADGTVNKVDILSARPARVFDRAVIDAALRWRFEPPGQPRETEVEFVFDRSKGR